MELVVRIELTTCSLRMSCSAIEPHQQILNRQGRVGVFGALAAANRLTERYYTIKLRDNQEGISVFLKKI